MYFLHRILLSRSLYQLKWPKQLRFLRVRSLDVYQSGLHCIIDFKWDNVLDVT